MRTSHYHITTLYYLDMVVVKRGWAMGHVVLCWLVTVQHSLQHTVTFVVEKKIDKNCGKEKEEDSFVDKIKEVLKGDSASWIVCVCVCVCVCVMYVCLA